MKSINSDNSSKVLELTIKRTVASDSGVYICMATNPHGVTSANFTLFVEGKHNVHLYMSF